MDLQFDKIRKRMLLVIPAMILCMIGDYCIGIEPADSKPLNDIVSSGWLTVSDWRIALSNITGAIGCVLYAIGAVAFIQFLTAQHSSSESKADKTWLRSFYAGLGTGCVSFMYFHIACGGLIQHFNVLFEAEGGNADKAFELWLRMFLVEAAPFALFFVAFDVLTTVCWIALIIRKTIPLSKKWILAAPLVTAGIGQLLELIPLPFAGIGSGFESLGWMLMFIGGIKYLDSCNER